MREKISSNFKCSLYAFLYSYIAMVLLFIIYGFFNTSEAYLNLESLFIPVYLPFLFIYDIFYSPIYLFLFLMIFSFIFYIYKNENINEKIKIIFLTIIFVFWDILSFYLFRIIALAY